jgi:predicted dienelactone hydrolase
MLKFLRLLVLRLILFIPAGLTAAGYPVGVISSITLHDDARHRDIPILIYYPKSPHPERFPIILFSHGAGGSRDGYDYLGRAWAEHGYISIHPTHKGSDRSMLKRGRPLVNLRTIRAMMEDPSNLILRPQDIAFLLNTLPTLEEIVPVLKNRADPTRVGVAGHSLGAYTSLAVAGSTVYPPGQTKRTLGDTRPLAYLALSPQGANELHGPFHSDSWMPVARPIFLVTGTEDRGFGTESPSWRTEAYRGLRPGHKYLAILRGANHMDFADTQLDGTVRNTRIHRWLQKATNLFWDAYLKRDSDALTRLQSEGWPEVKGVKVRCEKK